MKISSILTLLPLSTAYKSYKNYQVFRLNSTQDYNLGAQFEKVFPNYDIWNVDKNFTDIMVPPYEAKNFLSFCRQAEWEAVRMIENVGELIDGSSKPRSTREARSTSNFLVDNIDDFNYKVYHNLDEINNWMDKIAEKYKSFMSIENVGYTHENRLVRALKIAPFESTTTDIFFFNAGIHAREWISPASMMKVVSILAENFVNNRKDEVEILSKMDVYRVDRIENWIGSKIGSD